jgi:hypothetical protein
MDTFGKGSVDPTQSHRVPAFEVRLLRRFELVFGFSVSVNEEGVAEEELAQGAAVTAPPLPLSLGEVESRSAESSAVAADAFAAAVLAPAAGENRSLAVRGSSTPEAKVEVESDDSSSTVTMS